MEKIKYPDIKKAIYPNEKPLTELSAVKISKSEIAASFF